MKKKFIKPNKDLPGKVIIEQMFVCVVDVTEDDAMICGSGLTPSSDFVLSCNHEQLRQVLSEGDRHHQGLMKIVDDVKAGKFCRYEMDPVFINNLHLHATVIEMANKHENGYLLDSVTVVNSSDNDKIWLAYTTQICGEYLRSHFLNKDKEEREPLSESILLRLAYIEFGKTFPLFHRTS